MKNVLLILFSVTLVYSCESNSSEKSIYLEFANRFETTQFTDTLSSVEKGWAKGSLYEVESPQLSDSLFYNFIDTSKLSYKRWDERLYAEGKIKLDDDRTAFFVSRQYEDITYDRTTLLLIFNNGVFEKDVVFSEFVGYESEINEIQSKLFKNKKGEWIIIRTISNSYNNMETGETVENKEKEEFRIVKSL